MIFEIFNYKVNVIIFLKVCNRTQLYIFDGFLKVCITITSGRFSGTDQGILIRPLAR